MPSLNRIKRVLVLRCGALGDLVCGTSVIEAMRAQYGASVTIDFVCTPAASTLFEYDERVHRVFQLRQRHVPLWLSPQKQAIVRASNAEPYDLLINTESGPQFESLVGAIRARHKTGWFFSNPVPEPFSHMVDICKATYVEVVDEDVLRAALPGICGKPFGEVRAAFALPDTYLALSPGNSHRRRRRLNHRAWPHDQWLQLLAQLPPTLPVIVLGASDDDPLAPVRSVDHARVINLMGRTSVAEMITIIAAASGLVVTDTGTAHVAAAVNTPVVCLIGPTNAAITGPYRTSHNVVYTLSEGLACAPCHDTAVMRTCMANRCMQEITPHRVIQTLQQSGILAAPISAA